MGVDTRRPPLPAPTEPSTLSSADDTPLRDDLATDISTRTDKTSYSIPEDGTPITISTAKREKGIRKKYPSQTSLLIEYFEAGKNEGKPRSRPSVRVRVTPSSRKSKTTNDHVQITETSRNPRKPSYTRRISLGNLARDEAVHTTEASYSEGSNVSSLPPIEVEVLQNTSDLSSNGARFIPATSDISSMPADSMLGGAPQILPPGPRRSRSSEREEISETVTQDTRDTLKAPTRQRSRSLSKERITQRVMEKLQQKPVESGSSRVRITKSSREELTPSRKSERRRSKSSRDEELSAVSGTDSSLLSSNAHRRSGDTQSVRSGASGTSSLTNPKLLTAVEDAIKRLILPELTAMKEQQNADRNRTKFDRTSRESAYETVESTSSREPSQRRRVSKSSSAPHIHGNKGPKVVLNRDGDDPGTTLSGSSSRRDRRSSRGSEHSYSESITREEEKVRRKKSKDKDGHSTRDAALAGLGAAGLTAAALKHHDSRESKEDRKERKRRHSKSGRSRTASVSESVEEEHYRERRGEVPPLPILQSELQGSEITRESILSAETETRERPSSRSSRGTGAETPLREVTRGIASPSPRTPTRTPVALQRGLGTAHTNKSQTEVVLGTPKSDRSFSSRSREINPAGLEAAAAAKARALESNQTQVSQYEIAEEQTPTRGLSPIQSEASYREQVEVTGSPHHLRSAHSGATVSSTGHKAHRQSSNLSIQSFESSPSTKAARTRKRPQGMSLERGKEIMGEPDTPRDIDEFFEQNHEQNEMYRRELESSQHGSPYLDYSRLTTYTEDSGDGAYLDGRDDKMTVDPSIRKVGSNPEYVHTPMAVESAVASLHEPSNISLRSSVSSPLKKSRLSQVSPAPDQHYTEETYEVREHPSNERWSAIRNQAQTLAANSRSQSTNSPRQSLSRSIDEQPKMHANAFPAHGDMMPEIGFGVDDESDISTNPSMIKGPLGGGEYDDHTEALLSRQEERERTPSQHSYGKAAAIGAGVGAAAIAAAAAARSRDDSPAAHGGQYGATVEDDEYEHYDEEYAGEQQYSPQPNYAHKDRIPSRSPAMWKDEGYQSANQQGITPDHRNRSKLLDDEGLGDYDEEGLRGIFAPDSKHTRQFSGNSHGMSSPLYDSATGKGVDRIQSKDVVALMDHLTVRDAQRNARDTEILVTLVRSAAEMRNSFEEMKQFIRTQDAMIMSQNDKRADLTEQRVLGGPRPQPLGSPRVPRSSSEDVRDFEKKKQSVFKRALKGLSMKGDNDIKKIEEMFLQLLGEVEEMKHSHALILEQNNRSNSLTSYENLRASGDPGYEPEGRANTASSPNQSGYLSNPSSRRIQDLHSGYDVHQPHRISTVEEEDDEEFADNEEQYVENTERMTTPTQEARRNNSIPQETPPQAAKPFRESQSQENTPKRKHKSNSSSIFGIPKISRWSKTTASTNPESLPRNSGGSGDKRPYSTASRSGSQVNVAYYGDAQYELQEEDRLRSRSSSTLAKEERVSVRSPSPLIPEKDQPQYILDDPKYQAHRNSLNLQHPQPRPGPTGRHHNQLESQAQIYDPVRSPDFDPDQWGSNPSLARNRLSGGGASQGPGNLSPISSDGGYSQHSAAEQAAAPPRPPKIRDDGPLIPQQPLAGHGQTRQMYSAQNDFGSNSQGALTPLAPIQEVRYSLETDTGHHYSPTPSPRPNNLNPAAAMTSPQRKITGPRPMGSRSPSAQQGPSGPRPDLQHSDTVIRRKPVGATDRADVESLDSYRSSDSETF